MQITDIQEIPDVSPDTIKLINAALEEEKPDLVVLTGDQIKGYGVSYKGKGDALIESVAETVGKLLKPVTDRHIPFAVTFGNHDRQVGISNKDQFEKIYKALPGCVGEQAEGIDGGGTYNIPILSSDGERTAFNLYLFDSGTDAKGGGYEPFDPQIIDWYKKKRDELKAKMETTFRPLYSSTYRCSSTTMFSKESASAKRARYLRSEYTRASIIK